MASATAGPHLRRTRRAILDVRQVPGGLGTRREVGNRVLVDWIASVEGGCTWITSVCTGVFLLHAPVARR